MSIAYAGSVGFFGSGERNKIEKLLERFEDAHVAYSLRDLNGNPNFDVVRVRRSIGGEQDFTAKEINDGDLVTFCTADGFNFSSASGAFGFTFPQGDESGTYLLTASDEYTKNDYWQFTKNFTGTWVLNYSDGTNLYRIDSFDSNTAHPKDVDWSSTNTNIVVTSTPANFHGSYYGNTYNFLSDTVYYSFTTGNDGFVSIWYDQAGSNDATKTSLTQQPLIVNSGSLVTAQDNGEPAVLFERSLTASRNMDIPTISTTQSLSSYFIGGTRKTLRWLTRTTGYVSPQIGGSWDGVLLKVGASDGANSGNEFNALYTLQKVGTTATYRKNGVDRGSGTCGSSITINSFHLFPNNGIGQHTAQEAIIFLSDTTSNQETIENDMINHYGIS